MFKGKMVLVTGGSRGIGEAVCRKFAENGADVAFVYAGSTEKSEALAAELSDKYGVRSKCYKCDVADFDAVADTVKQVTADFGTVDVLINNAGITNDKLVLGMKEDDFDRVIDVNLKGTFNTIRQVYPIMARRKSGRIINISSVAGLMGNPGQANYAASKAGVIGLTKTVAKELASRGITVNAIAPGVIETDMMQGMENSPIMEQIPMKRAGRAEEVASLAVFLASDAAGYITGEVIRIDGGLGM
nr:3-oxoacyl-[acyl-carrier-protein] reductase [Clostridia bacterium]